MSRTKVTVASVMFRYRSSLYFEHTYRIDKTRKCYSFRLYDTVYCPRRSTFVRLTYVYYSLITLKIYKVFSPTTCLFRSKTRVFISNVTPE